MRSLNLVSALCVLAFQLAPLRSCAQPDRLKCTLPAQDYNGLYDIRGASTSATSAAACAAVCHNTSRCNMAAYVASVKRCYPKTVPFSQPATEARAGVTLVLPQRSKLSCTDLLNSGSVPTPAPPPAPTPIPPAPTPPAPTPPGLVGTEPPSTIECKSNADCSYEDDDYRPICGSQQTCVACERATQRSICGPGQGCSADDECVDCQTDQDCALRNSDPFCVPFRGSTACVGCRSDLDCSRGRSEGPVCTTNEFEGGRCRVCDGDQGCEDNEICLSFTCVERCDSDAFCVNGVQAIMPDGDVVGSFSSPDGQGVCRGGGLCEGCRDSMDCSSQAKICTRFEADSLSYCEECESSADCDDGLNFCNARRCEGCAYYDDNSDSCEEGQTCRADFEDGEEVGKACLPNYY